MALAGIPRQSNRSQGGIKTVWIAPYSAVTFSGVTAGEIDFTCSADTFKEFKPRKEAGSTYVDTEQVSTETAAVAFEKILTMLFTDYTVAKRNELAVLSNEETVAVVEWYNGNIVMSGHEEGMDTNGSEANSGSGIGEGSKLSIVLRALESVPTVFVDSATYDLIKAGSAVT